MNTPQTPSLISIYHLLASDTVIFLIPHLKTVRQHHQNGIIVFYLSLSKEHRFWQLLAAGSVILRVWELSGEVPDRIIYDWMQKRGQSIKTGVCDCEQQVNGRQGIRTTLTKASRIMSKDVNMANFNKDYSCFFLSQREILLTLGLPIPGQTKTWGQL